MMRCRCPAVIEVPAWARTGPRVRGSACSNALKTFIDTLRQRPYSVLIFSSLSRLAIMDSSTELFPLIHAPPSRRRESRISSDKGP
jgi:hypothetical protein